MREHQIVITLKPEQFMEVQRLSRAAGAKSMGMFVRQKLLAALGFEVGSSEGGVGSDNSVKLVSVSAELKRLHGELKIFVNEALSKPYIEGAGVADLQEVEDPLVQKQPTSHALPNKQTATGAQVKPDDGSVFEDFDNIEKHFEDAKDELEQLAQKAFAISPRLGVLETPGDFEELKRRQGKAKDPLGELLESPVARPAEQSAPRAVQPTDDDLGEDQIIEVPITIPKRAQKTLSDLPAEVQPLSQDELPSAPEDSLSSSAPTVDPTTSLNSAPIDPSAVPIEALEDDQPPPSLAPPENPSGASGSAFSGGPPPRKR